MTLYFLQSLFITYNTDFFLRLDLWWIYLQVCVVGCDLFNNFISGLALKPCACPVFLFGWSMLHWPGLRPTTDQNHWCGMVHNWIVKIKPYTYSYDLVFFFWNQDWNCSNILSTSGWLYIYIYMCVCVNCWSTGTLTKLMDLLILLPVSVNHWFSQLEPLGSFTGSVTQWAGEEPPATHQRQ